MDALTEIGGTTLEHPPYSPDASPCDVWAFPTMKKELRGKKSACSTIPLKTVCYTFLRSGWSVARSASLDK
jgi:hypothetical protein